MAGQAINQHSFKDDWSNIDQTADPTQFVQFMDGLRPPDAHTLQSYRMGVDLLQVVAGDHLLDVGCGTGGAVRVLAQLVGSTGRVVGVDNSATMITAAQQRAEGLDLPLAYRVADAHALPFADASFSGCYAEGVFEILTDPEQVLREMIRVARPGARVVIPAVDAPLIDGGDRALTRRIVDFICDHEVNGWLGRQMPRIYKENGLTDITVTPQVWVLTDYTLVSEKWLDPFVAHAQEAGVVTAPEASVWRDELEQHARAGSFFFFFPTFWISGRKS